MFDADAFMLLPTLEIPHGELVSGKLFSSRENLDVL